jgi:EAL domain-containing protein (putative c-di-GMP-specific phosphodiesterase class I)/FixJ family two-component response regulator
MFRSSGMSTIIIDDDPFAQKMLSLQLNTLGIKTIEIFNAAREALAFLHDNADSQTLVLCDLQMPGIDGVEVVRHLGSSGYAGGLALISGEEERILQTAALLANAHHLNFLGALHKPVALDSLRALLDRHFSAPAQGARVARPWQAAYSADELRQAIAEQQIICYFQPKVCLSTGQVVGVESLARWQHPRDGLVFPDRFIALAEETGLINQLTDAVLHATLREARCWQDTGVTLTIAVNVSMDNLTRLDFPEKVMTALDKTGVAPQQLVLEVTETQLIKDRMAALDIMTRLRLKQIGLSIDDFGTGSASFLQLRDLPFTELKIDRGFVHGAASDSGRRAIFDASLKIARDLGLKTIAEGAEDAEDWHFLRGTGCDCVQGYVIARPMPGRALPAWIKSWTALYREI